MYRLAIGDKPLHCSSVQVRAHLEVQVEGSISPCPALPCPALFVNGVVDKVCWLVCFFVFLFFLGAANTVMCRRQRRSAQLQTGFSTISSITSIDRYLPPCRRRQRVLPGAQQHGQRPTIVRNVETCRKWRKSMFSALSSSQRSACHESDVC